jgi:hypothetical protein
MSVHCVQHSLGLPGRTLPLQTPGPAESLAGFASGPRTNVGPLRGSSILVLPLALEVAGARIHCSCGDVFEIAVPLIYYARSLNTLKIGGNNMYHLDSAHRGCLGVPYGSHNKQRLFPQTVLTGWWLLWRRSVFPVRCELLYEIFLRESC